MAPKKGTFNLTNAQEFENLPTYTEGPIAEAFLSEGAENDIDEIMGENGYYASRSGSCGMLISMMMGQKNEKGEPLYTYDQICDPNALLAEKQKFYKEFRESTLNPKRNDAHFKKYDQLLVDGTKRLVDDFTNEVNNKIPEEDPSWLFNRDLFIKSDILMGITTNVFGDSEMFRERHFDQEKIKSDPDYAKQTESIQSLRVNTMDYIQLISPQNLAIQQYVTLNSGSIPGLFNKLDKEFDADDFDTLFTAYGKITNVQDNLKELGDPEKAIHKKQYDEPYLLPRPYIDYVSGGGGSYSQEKSEKIRKAMAPVQEALKVINTDCLTRIGALYASYNGTLAKRVKIELEENEETRKSAEDRKKQNDEKVRNGQHVDPEEYLPDFFDFDIKAVTVESDKLNKIALYKEAFESAPQKCMEHREEAYFAAKEIVADQCKQLKALESRNPSNQWKLITQHLEEMSKLLEKAGNQTAVSDKLKEKIGKTFDKLDYLIDDYVSHKNQPGSSLKASDMKRVDAVKEITANLKCIRDVMEQPALDKEAALNDSAVKDPFSEESLQLQTEALEEIYKELKSTRRTFDGSSQQFDDLMTQLEHTIDAGKELKNWEGEKSFQTQFLPTDKKDYNEYAETAYGYFRDLNATLECANRYLFHKKISNNESTRSLTRMRCATKLEEQFKDIAENLSNTYRSKQSVANADVEEKLKELRKQAQEKRKEKEAEVQKQTEPEKETKEAKEEKEKPKKDEAKQEKTKKSKEPSYDQLMHQKAEKMQEQMEIFYEKGRDGKYHRTPVGIRRNFFENEKRLPDDPTWKKTDIYCCKQLKQDLVMVFSGLSKDESIIQSGKNFFAHGEMDDGLRFGAQAQYRKIKKSFQDKGPIFEENWKKAEKIAIQGMANEFSRFDRLDERTVFASNLVSNIMAQKADANFPYEENLVKGMQAISSITQKGFAAREILAKADNMNTPEIKEAMADYLTMRVVESQMRQFARSADPMAINPLIADIGSGKSAENIQKLKDGVVASDLFKSIATLKPEQVHSLVKNNSEQNDKAMEQYMESLGGDVYAKKHMKMDDMSKQHSTKNIFATLKQENKRALPMGEPTESKTKKAETKPQKGGPGV